MLSGTKDEEPHDGGLGAIVFEPQAMARIVEVFCDADHAGDLGT